MENSRTRLNLLSTPSGRKVLFTCLYMSEGAPIGYIWWALPTRFRAAGVPLEAITALTSLLVLPWVFKFLWAPLIDTARTVRWSLRSWILAMQLVMGAALIPLAVLDFQSSWGILVFFLFLHAVSAATQDAAIDALAIASVPAVERGRINGWMQAGMLVGRSLLGGGSLMLATQLGQKGVVILLVAVILFSSILLLFSQEIGDRRDAMQTARERWVGFSKRLRGALRQRSSWFGLAFAAIGGTCYEAVGAVVGPYLIDRGFAQEDVGAFFSFPSIAGMLVGVLIGGIVADRIGRKRAVRAYLLFLVLSVWGLVAVDATSAEGERLWVVLLLTILYIGIGLFTTGSYALFMDITDPRLGATQFSAFMGATNACESWSSFAVGRLIPLLGYPAAFVSMSLVSLSALPVLKNIQASSGIEQENRG